MGRGRTRWVVAAALCALALVVVTGRWLWLRQDRREAEHSALVLTREAHDALALLHRVTDRRAGADEHNAVLEGQRDGVRALAAAMHTELDRARADTTAADVGAFTSGAQANNLGACLTGVSRALNQLAVGDTGAIASLQAVDRPCRAAGIS